MKKVLCFMMALIGCITMSACGGETKETSNVSKEKEYSVKITVDCISNLLLNRYDVDILADEEKIGNLEHGSEDTYTIKLTKGEHTLKFVKEGSSSVDGSVNLSISGDTEIGYEIYCRSEQIEVEKNEINEHEKKSSAESSEDKKEKVKKEEKKEEEPVLSENQVRIPYDSDYFTYEKYKEVINELNQLGFNNIKTEIVYDVGTGWLASISRDDVKSISINGKSEFEKGDIFEKNCEIIITYHEFKINDPSIQYNSYTVAKLIQELESNAMNAKDAHTGEYVKITGRIDSIDADGKSFYLYPSNNNWAFQGVLCVVQTDEQKEKLKSFKSGNNVTVKGKITSVGEVLGYYMDVYIIQ